MRPYTAYTDKEKVMWAKFKRLVLYMTSANDTEADTAFKKAKQFLKDNKLKWDDRPGIIAAEIATLLPVTNGARPTRVNQEGMWKGKRLRNLFRTDGKHVDWEGVTLRAIDALDRKAGRLKAHKLSPAIYDQVRSMQHRVSKDEVVFRGKVRQTLRRARDKGLVINPSKSYWGRNGSPKHASPDVAPEQTIQASAE
jgi:hypothetical protein